MLNQRVHDQTTHLNDKYERLTVDYEEPRRLVMEIRSYMGGSYAPPKWPHGPGNDQPPPPPVPPLF
jgi:hypothetical protein